MMQSPLNTSSTPPSLPPLVPPPASPSQPLLLALVALAVIAAAVVMAVEKEGPEGSGPLPRCWRWGREASSGRVYFWHFWWRSPTWVRPEGSRRRVKKLGTVVRPKRQCSEEDAATTFSNYAETVEAYEKHVAPTPLSSQLVGISSTSPSPGRSISPEWQVRLSARSPMPERAFRAGATRVQLL